MLIILGGFKIIITFRQYNFDISGWGYHMPPLEDIYRKGWKYYVTIKSCDIIKLFFNKIMFVWGSYQLKFYW